MSPILKRDVSEHIRQARKLASVVVGSSSSEWQDPHASSSTLATSSSPRKGLAEVDEPPDTRSTRKGRWKDETPSPEDTGNTYPPIALDSRDRGAAHENGHIAEDLDGAETQGMLPSPWASRIEEMGFRDTLETSPDWRTQGKWKDLRNLLFESTPSLLLSLIGLVFTGELLEHLARWQVFRRVDELFILVPMIGNLKGNLEMCLSARLGTSANIGELDHRLTRKALLAANMTLLCLQALLISSLAAFLSFVLGLITRHRLGDKMQPSGGFGDDAGLGVGDGEWHEGYTRPGWKQLVMVLATGMGAAAISAMVLGNFMGALVVVSRWLGLDPDNITPPLAACLGDLMTLFVLACIGTLLVGMMDTPVPLLAVIIMCVGIGWFLRRVMRNEWIRKVARGAWAPLIVAMFIASGAGMVLDRGVGKYRGFALLSISMGGLTGSIGAIHANRLSTTLHTKLHIRSPTEPRPALSRPDQLSPKHNMLALYLLSFPCQGCFLLFVQWADWIDLSLGWAGWLCFATTTAISLLLAHYLTHFFWARDLDPDSYTLPIHSALVDFIGSLLLMLAYEICINRGIDVIAHSPSETAAGGRR